MANPINGRRVVEAVGIRASLADTSTQVSRVDIQAMANNTGTIYVGGANTSAESGFENGLGLEAGETVNFQNCDLHEIYIDATVAGEGVTFLVS